MKRHKHSELIKAWADGAEIQWDYGGDWTWIKNPEWNVDCNYRIKPRPDVVNYYNVSTIDGAVHLHDDCENWDLAIIFEGKAGGKIKDVKVNI
jgi:hypothetical protein